jgi:hypothetical protein
MGLVFISWASSPTLAELHQRAEELIGQLGLEAKRDPARGVSSAELAATVERTLNLPQIAQLREKLIPEHTAKFSYRVLRTPSHLMR